jgi:flagellar P-ring protein precursor FlgI
MRTRLKDLVTIEGVRDNQLIGYDLVVGLAGTGDRRQTMFSDQSLTNLLERMGVSLAPTAIRVNSTAAVMVTAILPPFAQPGSRLVITAAAIGDCSNLPGGILVLTSLRGADGQVYAAAQAAASAPARAATARPSTIRLSAARLPRPWWSAPLPVSLRSASFAPPSKIPRSVVEGQGYGV